MKLFQRLFFNLFFTILFFSFPISSVYAQDNQGTYMRIWEENSLLASKYLRKAEEYLKEGNKQEACKMQLKASLYGVKGGESLIKAFELSQTNSRNLQEIKEGIDTWRHLAKLCSLSEF